MANIKSQIKRNRQNEKKRVLNRVDRGRARTYIKQAHKSFESDDQVETASAVRIAVSALDKAASKGVLHKNNAARRKSRLMKRQARAGK